MSAGNRNITIIVHSCFIWLLRKSLEIQKISYTQLRTVNNSPTNNKCSILNFDSWIAYKPIRLIFELDPM